MTPESIESSLSYSNGVKNEYLQQQADWDCVISKAVSKGLAEPASNLRETPGQPYPLPSPRGGMFLERTARPQKTREDRQTRGKAASDATRSNEQPNLEPPQINLAFASTTENIEMTHLRLEALMRVQRERPNRNYDSALHAIRICTHCKEDTHGPSSFLQFIYVSNYT